VSAANVEIILTGFGVVMGVLALLWATTVVVGQVVVRAGRKPLEPAPTSTASDDIPAHHLVAIAAAVHAVLDRPHRVVAIEAPPHRVTGWARASWFSPFGGFDRKTGKR
jgi:glutaconyl-CoA/methylmalonyl-CoA decarboxylase subunit delta